MKGRYIQWKCPFVFWPCRCAPTEGTRLCPRSRVVTGESHLFQRWVPQWGEWPSCSDSHLGHLTLKRKKKKKKTCLINIFVSFRKRCCVTKAEFIFLFSIKWKIKLTYPKNAFPTRKQTNKKPLSFWFLRRAIHFQTSLPALASKHSGYDKPLCQFSSAWFG